MAWYVVLGIVGSCLSVGAAVVYFGKLFSRVAGIFATLEQVAAQFKKNGGNSLRDRIDKQDEAFAAHRLETAEKLQANRDAIAAVRTDVAIVKRRQTQIASDIKARTVVVGDDLEEREQHEEDRIVHAVQRALREEEETNE